MGNVSIEQLDKSRNNLSKWFAIGWGSWYGIVIIKEWVSSPAIIGILVLAGLLACGFWIFSLVKIYRWNKVVNADPMLKRALNDELHQSHNNKSLVVGYTTTVAAIAFLIGWTTFSKIQALIALEIILYVSVLSVLIASLYYKRS